MLFAVTWNEYDWPFTKPEIEPLVAVAANACDAIAVVLWNGVTTYPDSVEPPTPGAALRPGRPSRGFGSPGWHLASVDLFAADAQDAPRRSTARRGDRHLWVCIEREEKDRGTHGASIRSVAHQSHVVSPQRPRPFGTKPTTTPGGAYSA